MKNRNNAVRSVSKEERKDFEELKALYLQELEKAARANEPAAPQSEDKAWRKKLP